MRRSHQLLLWHAVYDSLSTRTAHIAFRKTFVKIFCVSLPPAFSISRFARFFETPKPLLLIWGQFTVQFTCLSTRLLLKSARVGFKFDPFCWFLQLGTFDFHDFKVCLWFLNFPYFLQLLDREVHFSLNPAVLINQKPYFRLQDERY